MLLTVRMDRNPSAARRGFVMRAGVMAGAVSVFAAGAVSFGAGSTSASPYMSPSRVGQVQPRNLALGSGRADVFAADDPADPGSPSLLPILAGITIKALLSIRSSRPPITRSSIRAILPIQTFRGRQPRRRPHQPP